MGKVLVFELCWSRTPYQTQDLETWSGVSRDALVFVL
jgi:hypothetical protein